MHERGARRSLAGPGALFFPPRAEPRIKQPRRGSLQALFFAPDGLLPSRQPRPPAIPVAVPRAKPKMAGVAVTVFCQRKSLREIPP